MSKMTIGRERKTGHETQKDCVKLVKNSVKIRVKSLLIVKYCDKMKRQCKIKHSLR